MDTIWIVLIAVAAVVVLAALAAFVVARRRDHRRKEAASLRSQAAAHTPRVHESEREAQLREAEAERLRLEAERAQERAAEARTGVLQEQARTEDAVRRADRLDPSVDHRSDEYRPQAPAPRGPADDRHPHPH